VFSGPANDGPDLVARYGQATRRSRGPRRDRRLTPTNNAGHGKRPRLAPAATAEKPMWALSLLVNIEHDPAGALPEVTYIRRQDS
jgi:hypothetical protein